MRVLRGLLLITALLAAEPAWADVSLPEPLHEIEPAYPAGETGAPTVVLTVTTDEDGVVERAEVFESGGEAFDASALTAVQASRFEPARDEKGNPLRATFRFALTFAPPLPPVQPEPDIYAPPEKPGVAPAIIDVEVAGRRAPRGATRRTISRREISRIPGTNGDALRAVQSLPGVARSPGLVSQLIVRGSAPFDSQTFVDGIYVPLIYHFGGLVSVLPTEMLERIDFYPGNFSARYGRALGGVVDAGLRSPRKDGYHGLLQIDLIDARAIVEGPIPGTDDWSFAAGFRRSHVDAWLGPVLESAGAGVSQAPRYYDYQLIIEHDGVAKTRVALCGSDDALELIVPPSPGEPALSGNIGFATSFQRLVASFELPRGDHQLSSRLSLGHEKIRAGFGRLFINLEGYTFFGRSEYSYRPSEDLAVHAGLDVLGSLVEVSQAIPGSRSPGSNPSQPLSTQNLVSSDQQVAVFQPAAYVEVDARPLRRWRLTPGLRIDYTRNVDQADVSPRFNTRVDVQPDFPRTTLKAGVGLFTQPPQPQQATPPVGTAGLTTEKAYHATLGVEQQLTPQLQVSLEGYFKHLEDIVIARPSLAGTDSRWTNDGLGRSFGGELLLKYAADARFFGWLAYTLSRTTRQNGPEARVTPVPWDQTHILTVLGSYTFDDGWELGARFRLVTGNLVDPAVCDPGDDDCDPNRVNALFHAPSGAYSPIELGDNIERLPLFHQLDIRVDKAFTFEAWTLRLYLDLRNAYNRRAVEGIGYDARFTIRQLVQGLPILPSIGIRGEL